MASWIALVRTARLHTMISSVNRIPSKAHFPQRLDRGRLPYFLALRAGTQFVKPTSFTYQVLDSWPVWSWISNL